jgi:hypothetical protein
MTQGQCKQKRLVDKREPAQLASKLDARLLTYAIAASAAGIGTLGEAQPAQAEVVAHPANISVPYNGGIVQFDINGDGQMDFGLSWGSDKGPKHRVRRQTCVSSCGGSFSSEMKVIPAQGANQIWQAAGKAGFAGFSSDLYCAAALAPGRRVGPSAAFKGPGARAMFWQHDSPISGGDSACPWNFEGTRYLGVKFIDTKGNLHYGWVRVALGFSTEATLTITGYAYETVPNKPITTGVTRGEDAEMLAPAPASLGWLAVGAPGLAIWRRPEEQLAA